MKAITLFLLIFNLTFTFAQNKITDSTTTINRGKISKDENTFYIYENNDTCLFTKINPITKKEEIMPVCFYDLYLSYLSTAKKNIEKISIKEVEKTMDKPELFRTLVEASR